MQSVRIRVEGSSNAGYVVRLLTDAESAGGNDAPSESIPADLDAAVAPAELGGAPVDEAVRAFLKDNKESMTFAAIGDFLGRLLLRGEVGERLDALRDQHPDGFAVLLDVEPLELRLIPWELMSRDQGRLFLDEKVRFARIDELRADESQELVPLRLLVVEGERDDTIGTLTEIRGIKTALPEFQGQIDAEFLSAPTEVELRQAFARVRPHIFHFMGHGIRDPADEKSPALRVGEWPLTRQYILDRVLAPSPRLVVLNACRSGDVEGIRSLTEAFLSRGAAAVIAMQGDVRGRAAGRFGSTLYRELAAGRSIDETVAHARIDVLTQGGNPAARDWCLPSLTLRVAPRQVLPFVCGIEKVDREFVERDLFKQVKLFVDRTDKRWELAEAADPDGDQGTPERVLLVVGDAQVGKTALVNWVRTRCALRGRRVRYVSFKGEDNIDFVNALRVIEETPEDLRSRAGPDHAFDRFNYDVGFLVTARIPPDPSAGELPRTFPELPATLQLGSGNDERILESFRSALAIATENEPLLLVFDDLGKLRESDFKTWIFPHLVQRIADGDPPNVRLLLVLSNENKRDYWPAESTVGRELRVDAISVDDYAAWAEDVLLALGLELDHDHEALIALAKRWVPPLFKPTELERLVGMVEER